MSWPDSKAQRKIRNAENRACTCPHCGHNNFTMSNQEITAKLVAKMQKLDIIELTNFVFEMNRSLADYADTLVSAGLDALEARMSESEFIRFCGQLEAAL